MAHEQSPPPSYTLSLFPLSSENHIIDLTDDDDEEEEEVVMLNKDSKSVSRKRKSTCNFSVKEQKEKKKKHEGETHNLISNIEDEVASSSRTKQQRQHTQCKSTSGVQRTTKQLPSTYLTDKEEAVILNKDIDFVSPKRKWLSKFAAKGKKEKKKEHECETLNLISNIEEEQRRSEFPEGEFASSSRIKQLPSTDLSLSISEYEIFAQGLERSKGVSKRNSNTIMKKFHDKLPMEWLSLSIVAESEIYVGDFKII